MAIKLSSKTHYGLRAMVDLARAYGTGPLALGEIAEAEGISLRYLEQLAATLRRAGLIQATRGVQGGYQLNSDPTSITVGRIVRVLEGPIILVPQCDPESGKRNCARQDICSSREVWSKAREALNGVFDSITLADLCAAGNRGEAH